MKRYPVLDDYTRSAEIIGYATSAGAALRVYMRYMRDRMDSTDFSEMELPRFVYLSGSSSAIGIAAWEPQWSRSRNPVREPDEASLRQTRKRRGPPKGKVPPQLRRYLFKRGHGKIPRRSRRRR